MRIDVTKQNLQYGRSAIMYIQNGVIQFDTADLEYGKGIITIETMEKAIAEYKKKLNDSRINK